MKRQSANRRMSALAAAALCFLLILSAGAQSPASSAVPATPTVEQVLNRYVEAIGGRAAWEKLHSRTSLGRIVVPSMGLIGTVMIHEKAPNKVLLVVIFGGQAFRQGYDGTVGWSDDPQEGMKEKTGAQLEEAQRDADFYRPLHMEKAYTKLSVVGQEKVGDRDTWVVHADLPKGGSDKIYFGVESGLILRAISQQYTENGMVAVTEDFKDYRDVDGVKLPFEILQVNGNSSLTITLDKVQHNVELDDSEFAEPAAQ